MFVLMLKTNKKKVKINQWMFLGVEGFKDKSQSYAVATEGLLYVCVASPFTLDPSLYSV